MFGEPRHALRSLSRTPVTSLAAIISLGIGIGAASAVYSVADAIFFRTLRVPDADALVSLYQRDEKRAGFSSHAWLHYLALHEQAKSFEELAAFSRIPVNARLNGATERVITEVVSSNYFRMMRVAPCLGRAFQPGDEQVAVLGARLWRDRFGSDPGVPGRTMILNGQAFTIIGVLPESFESVVLDWGKPPQLWIPAEARSVLPSRLFDHPGAHWMLVTGRLRAGATIEQAQSEAEAVSQQYYAQYPLPGANYRPVAMPVQEARFWPGQRESLKNYMARIQASDPLFHAGRTVLAEVDLLSPGYDEARNRQLLDDLLRRVRELPGVEEAAYVKTVPLGGFRGARDAKVNGTQVNLQVNTISPRYFAAAGLPLLAGRDLRDGETASVVINEQMAERFWPGQSPLGRVIETPRTKQQFTVAGVVRDGRMRNFREESIAPCVYLPLAADPQPMITLYARTDPPPEALLGALREVFRATDREIPFEASTLARHLARATSRERLAASSLSGLGAFTALLAAVGLYGLISVAVSRRSREIGIRMALGARPAGVVAEILLKFAWLLGAGVAAGLAACSALSRYAESLVFGVRATDPATFLMACGLMGLIAALASAAPAWRAARTDPWQVLRQD